MTYCHHTAADFCPFCPEIWELPGFWTALGNVLLKIPGVIIITSKSLNSSVSKIAKGSPNIVVYINAVMNWSPAMTVIMFTSSFGTCYLAQQVDR